MNKNEIEKLKGKVIEWTDVLIHEKHTSMVVQMKDGAYALINREIVASPDFIEEYRVVVKNE